MTGNEVTRGNRGKWKLLKIDPLDRKAWMTGLGTSEQGASQLPGRRPTDLEEAPTLFDNQKDPKMMTFRRFFNLIIIV